MQWFQVTLDLEKKDKDEVVADVKELLSQRLNLTPASTKTKAPILPDFD